MIRKVLSQILMVTIMFVMVIKGFTDDHFDMEINTVDQTKTEYVDGVVGGRILLPCDVTAPTPTDSPILVLFYVENKKTPIYSMDLRRSSLYAAHHWSDPDLDGRVTLQVDTGNQGLLLQKIREKDEGLYRCRVDFKASPTRNSKVVLHVIEPPRHLLITSKWKVEKVVSKVAGPFPINAHLTLSCQVMGGDPPPKVTWWHEESLLDDVTEIKTNQMTRNTLHLPLLTRGDLMKKFTCQAVNSKLTTPLLSTVQIDLAFPPTTVKIQYPKQTRYKSLVSPRVLVVAEGEENPLRCEVEGSRPHPIVTWNINGNPVDDKFEMINSPNIFSDSSDTTRLTSTLMFIPQASDKDSLISCRAVNPQLPEETIYDTARLNVLYKPRLNLTAGKKINLKNIKEGNDVYFECLVDANPQAKTIIWSHNGVSLKHNPSVGVLLSSSGTSLILQDVTRSFSGTYTCTAINTRGSSTSNNLTMEVKFIPVCAMTNDSTIGGGLQEPVLATCRVKSHPLPSKFRWAFNSSRGLQDLSNHPNLNTSSSVLSYNIETTEDFGAFLCWADNALGRMKDPCVINVIPAAKPESVSSCEIYHNGSIPGSRVMVQCIKGWDGGLAQTFTLEARKAAMYKTNVLSAHKQSSEPLFELSNLQTGEKYLFTIIASNSRGESTPATLFYTIPGEVIAGLTHARTDPQRALQSFMPIIAIALGITITILFLVLFTVCTLRFKSKRNSSRAKNVTESLSVGDSSMQSIVESCTKEKETSSCNSIPRYNECSTLPLPKPLDCIQFQSNIRTLPQHTRYLPRENQGLLTPLPGEFYDEGNTYRRAEDVALPIYHFLPPPPELPEELCNSLGRSSTLSSGSTAPSTFRSSQSTVVFNPKCGCGEDNKSSDITATISSPPPESVTTSWLNCKQDHPL